MKSMTGYGRGIATLGTYTLTVQVSSVNRKTLDLAIKLPEEWESLTFPIEYQGEGYERPLKRSNDDAEG